MAWEQAACVGPMGRQGLPGLPEAQISVFFVWEFDGVKAIEFMKLPKAQHPW